MTRIEAVVVTTIRRTLADAVGAVPTYLVRQAVTTATERRELASRDRDQLLGALNGRSVR